MEEGAGGGVRLVGASTNSFFGLQHRVVADVLASDNGRGLRLKVALRAYVLACVLGPGLRIQGLEFWVLELSV